MVAPCRAAAGSEWRGWLMRALRAGTSREDRVVELRRDDDLVLGEDDLDAALGRLGDDVDRRSLDLDEVDVRVRPGSRSSRSGGAVRQVAARR